MKTNQKIKLVSLFIGLMLAALPTWAERGEEVEISKKVTVGLATEPDVTLELSNKYGRVEVRSWARDSVWMEAKITASGKTREQAEKVLRRVSVDYRESRRYFSVETQYETTTERPALISSFMNMLNDTKATLVDESNVKADYVLYVPENARLDLQNKFGDIILGQVSGRTTIDLAHGNLRADKLSGKSIRLQLSFGEGEIRQLGTATLVTKFAKIFIDQADLLRWRGVSSELTLLSARQLDLEQSQKDEIKLGELQTLSGKANFSRLTLGTLTQGLRLEMSFGRLHAELVQRGFQYVDLQTKSADINLRLDRESSYTVDVQALDDRLNFPVIWQQFLSDDDPLSESQVTDGERRIKGSIGENPESRLLLRAEGGHITIQD